MKSDKPWAYLRNVTAFHDNVCISTKLAIIPPPPQFSRYHNGICEAVDMATIIDHFDFRPGQDGSNIHPTCIGIGIPYSRWLYTTFFCGRSEYKDLAGDTVAVVCLKEEWQFLFCV